MLLEGSTIEERCQRRPPIGTPRRTQEGQRGPQDVLKMATGMSKRAAEKAPTGSQDGPIGPQDGHIIPHGNPTGGCTSVQRKPQEIPKIATGVPKRPSRGLHEGLKTAQDCLKAAQDGLRSAQQGPDGAPGSSRDSSSFQRSPGGRPPETFALALGVEVQMLLRMLNLVPEGLKKVQEGPKRFLRLPQGECPGGPRGGSNRVSRRLKEGLKLIQDGLRSAHAKRLQEDPRDPQSALLKAL